MDLVKKCMWCDPSAQESTAREKAQPNAVHQSCSANLPAAGTQRVMGQKRSSGGTRLGTGMCPASRLSLALGTSAMQVKDGGTPTT